MKTEEGQFIKVTATLVDHDTIKNFDDEVDQLDRWSFYPFSEPLEFNVKNMVKLSKAADPWSSSLAVYFDDDENLFIYGMIDQSIHYQSFLNYEREDKPEHPGIIQTIINGIGILNVMLDYEALATLNQQTLIKLYPNVFKIGPVSSFLKEHSAISKSRLEDLLEGELDEEDTEAYNEVVYDYTVQAICRILLKMKNYHHGGAVLITRNREDDLTPKYKMKYNRISLSIEHLITSITDEEYYEEKIENLKKRKKDVPIDDFDDYDDNKLEIEEAYNEMVGAVRFAASLSCVDGLVLMSPRLNVYGFGTVIAETVSPEYVYLSTASRPGNSVIKTPANHFGTRHQSMFAYCKKYPESVGFVVSQDGEVRAIKSINGKVYVWENIRVYQFQRSSKLPKNIPSR
ncbi:hypothetical protein GCM10022289_21120 [Pedobacter jeongneungensis]|uniref:Probable sensor domain-containing protein n=1 Tax=Pedobacter jeongneungensis TaxID=947309 RepID=A0ABP8BD82_9SPHI